MKRKAKLKFSPDRANAARHRCMRAGILEIRRHGPRFRAVMADTQSLEQERQHLLRLMQELREESVNP